ncbi:MAG: ceramide glucosyltransferase, partial [Roseomonas sp.]|nr:ceramide glucosyltransferase [Roseomonas sp.]
MSVVIAGEAKETAQKCANLAAAFRTLDGQDAAVVVFDGDIRPGLDWLGTLVGPVLDGGFDVVTGYRWLMPGCGGFSAQLVAWLDRGVAFLPK